MGENIMALTVKHLFPFLKLMKALNIKDELKKLIKNKVDVGDLDENEQAEVMQERGIEMVFMLMDKMPDAEREIKSFLALYSDQTLEQIEELPVEEFITLIRQFFAEPQLKSFFKQAAK
jgi:hypothetical protein